MQRTVGGQRRVATVVWLVLVGIAACSRAPAYEGSLTFKRDGKLVGTLRLSELLQLPGAGEIETRDPYYEARKRFRAFPIGPALQVGYGDSPAQLREGSYVLVALDGYRVPIDAARLLDDGAYVAVDDVDVPGFAPIGPRKVSPGPAYLVWAGQARTNTETHPRPWQLSSIERVAADALYPHTRPKGAPAGSLAELGFQLFRGHCIRCHAINREGGSVGPDLNVPQSIVAYRPEAQIRAYIKNPLTFRYGVMPANPELSEADLDALIAYFHAMSTQPHDPAPHSKAP